MNRPVHVPHPLFVMKTSFPASSAATARQSSDGDRARFPSVRRMALLLLFFLTPVALHAQTQFQGWCSQVKIEILQELSLERTGFEATLTVTNNDGADSITDFTAALTFEDPSLSTATVTNDASSLFFVKPPTIENVSRIDGNGIISPRRPPRSAGLSSRPSEPEDPSRRGSRTASAAISAASSRGWKSRSLTCSRCRTPSR